MTEPDQPIVPGTPPQGGAAICPHVSALCPPTGAGSIGHRTLGAVHLDPVVTVVAPDGDRSAGLGKLAEGALLLVDAAKAFELGAHTVGAILVGKAAEATSEGARLLGVETTDARPRRVSAFDHEPQFATLSDGTLARDGWSDHRLPVAGDDPVTLSVRDALAVHAVRLGKDPLRLTVGEQREALQALTLAAIRERTGPAPGEETVRAFVDAEGRADSGGWRLPERGEPRRESEILASAFDPEQDEPRDAP
jgi:hypothetical protein